jgi:hypothetical protein
MSKNGNDRKPDQLRRALQQGDPAGEGGLEFAERDRIRRQMVAAAEAPGRWPFPVFRPLGYALAGLAAVAVGWLALQSLPQQTGSLPVEPAADPAPLVAQDTPGELLPDTVVQEPAPPVQVAAQPVEQPTQTVASPGPVTPAILPPKEPREPRQMQFITGTTRVIWTLDPDFDLGPSSTAEQGEIS